MVNILHGLGLRLLALGHHTPFMVTMVELCTCTVMHCLQMLNTVFSHEYIDSSIHRCLSVPFIPGMVVGSGVIVFFCWEMEVNGLRCDHLY